MNRRGFLGMLGLAATAAAVPSRERPEKVPAKDRNVTISIYVGEKEYISADVVAAAARHAQRALGDA